MIAKPKKKLVYQRTQEGKDVETKVFRGTGSRATNVLTAPGHVSMNKF